MPFATNGDVRIYYEIEGSGPPLVLAHDLTYTHQLARDVGYVQALREDYAVILIDQRGMGRSSKPHDFQSYSREARVRDTIAVLDDLDIPSAHYWGYSGGAWRGWFCAKYAPERFRSMVLGGHVPFMDRPAGTPGQAFLDLQSGGMETLVSWLKAACGEHWSRRIERQVRSQDLRAITASFSVNDPPEIDRILPTLQIPILGYAGNRDMNYDRIRTVCRSAPMGRFVTLDEQDHMGAFFQIDLVLPRVMDFLKEVEQGIAREAGV